MPMIKSDDGVNLYYEEAGSGTPIVFVHEFAIVIAIKALQSSHDMRAQRHLKIFAR